MEIKHLKFESLDSTQTWVKENIINHLDDNLLVSAEKQLKGTGRLGNNWNQFGPSLAFTFLAKPCDPLTLTSLEVGVQIAQFLKINFGEEVFLKWPNDLLVKEGEDFKKVGGILSHYHNKDLLIIGVGINLEISRAEELKKKDFKFPPGHLNIDLTNSREFHHSFPYDFYNYFLKQRLSSIEVTKSWDRLCAHKDIEVSLVDGSNSFCGVFKGLGPNGEALVENSKELKKHISGSLFF